MDEAVNTEVETTTAETSPVSETVNTTEVSEPIEQSREDINTPVGETQNANAVEKKDLSERSVNRFQAMANRIRELETANSQYAQYWQQPQAYPQVNPVEVKLAQLETQNLILSEEQRLQNERALFREAEAKEPRLDPNSDQYDKDFDDAVTALYKNGNIEPLEAAKRVSKLLEKANQRAVQATQVENENKRAVSGNLSNRSTERVSDSQRMVEDAYKTFQSSRSTEDYARYLMAKRAARGQ